MTPERTHPQPDPQAPRAHEQVGSSQDPVPTAQSAERAQGPCCGTHPCLNQGSQTSHCLPSSTFQGTSPPRPSAWCGAVSRVTTPSPLTWFHCWRTEGERSTSSGDSTRHGESRRSSRSACWLAQCLVGTARQPTQAPIAPKTSPNFLAVAYCRRLPLLTVAHLGPILVALALPCRGRLRVVENSW